jgi:hypothetical protein
LEVESSRKPSPRGTADDHNPKNEEGIDEADREQRLASADPDFEP